MRLLLLSLAAFCSAALSAIPAQALICVACHLPVTHTWPTDPAPCNDPSNLQACINGAAAGDIVRIATNKPINESVSIQQSLTLQAAPGFHPLFAHSQGITGSAPSTSNAAIAIGLEGLALESGAIQVSQLSTEPLTVEILGNTIVSFERPVSVFGAIEVDARGSGLLTIDVSQNAIHVPSDEAGSTYGIYVGLSAGTVNGRIANNAIAMEGGSQGAGIEVDGYGSGTSFDVDLIANRISGMSSNGGLYVLWGTSGAAATRVLDNLVTGQVDTTDGAAAIVLNAHAGTLSASVSNNTVASNATGISLSSSAGGAITGSLTNNIVFGNTNSGIRFDALALSNGHNLVFGNGTDFVDVTPGPGTIQADPLFVDPSHGNYHLKPRSPAIDGGDDTAVPADLTTDLDGNPRMQGASVDIGALEAPAPSSASARAFTGELQIEIGGSQLAPAIYGQGTAVLNTGVSPPSFVIPAGVFVAPPNFVSFLAPNYVTRQVVSVTGQNAKGTFGAGVGKMPLSGLLRFARLSGGIVGTEAGAIDASPVGAPGKQAATFMYRAISTSYTTTMTASGEEGVPMPHYNIVTRAGTGMLTGQSFAVSKDSRTPAGGGHIQLVAPFSFASTLSTWNPSSSVTLALDFAPEPDRLALGAFAIAVLCGVGVAKRRALRA